MTQDERRKSDRFKHKAHALLASAQGVFASHMVNISSHGALIAVLDQHPLEPATKIVLHIDMSDGGVIELHGTVAHLKDHYIGLECEAVNNIDRARIEHLINNLDETA